MRAMGFACKAEKKKALPTVDMPVHVKNLGNMECLLCLLEKVHVGTSSSLEAEVDGGRGADGH